MHRAYLFYFDEQIIITKYSLLQGNINAIRENTWEMFTDEKAGIQVIVEFCIIIFNHKTRFHKCVTEI